MNYLKVIFLFCFLGWLNISCENSTTSEEQSKTKVEKKLETLISPLGKKLFPAAPSKKSLEKHDKAKQDFLKNKTDLENIIWYGRRTAYLGKYEDAIKIYSDGINQYPNEPRLYRHRGHRFISIRKYDEAISDFEKAAKLIDGKENRIEQDGLPNAQNIPISTLHGNIWYHLGLAYYLKHDFEKAFEAYQNCRNVGSNDDNIVSSTHWLYMIQRRLGNEELAQKQLEPIRDSMNIIENHSYYDLCKFYKGMIERKALLNEDGTPSGDAVNYGLANWDFYNGDGEAAKQGFAKLLESKSWSSFGYLAAEQDYLKHFFKKD